MDDTLIDAYLHQQTMGNRVEGTLTMHVLENIDNEFEWWISRYVNRQGKGSKLHEKYKNDIYSMIWYFREWNKWIHLESNFENVKYWTLSVATPYWG